MWVAPLGVSPSALDDLASVLSAGERDRAARFRFDDDAHRYTAAHGWLRLVLGSAMGLPPADVPLTSGPGKPSVAGAGGPHFRRSHAGYLALIAVAGREVGVDVEPLASGDRWASVADVACTPQESAALHALPAADRRAAFVRLWTAKEAYLKATGTGLAVEPDSVEVDLLDGLQPVKDGWHVLPIEPARGYLGAVAAQGDDWTVRLHSVDELVTGAARP